MIMDAVLASGDWRRLVKFTRRRYNLRANYLRCVKKPASEETSYQLPNIPGDMRTDWALAWADRGNAVNDFEREQREKLLSYDKKGPVGHTDPLLPIDLDVADEELHSDRVADILLLCVRNLSAHFLPKT